MTTKSRSATLCSSAKVLVIFTLVACINVVSAEAISKGVVRNSQTLDSLTVAHSGASIKRNLRSDTMTTSEHVNNYEERALAISIPGLNRAATSMKSGLSKLVQNLQLRWWQLTKKSPDDVFIYLKLGQTGDKLFETPGFSRWVNFVTANNKKTPEVAIFSTLSTRYSDEALAQMLVAAKTADSTKAIAAKLEGVQLTSWVTSGTSADGVFKILKLDKTGDKLFESPILNTWTTYVSTIHRNNPNEFMFAKLTDRYGDVALAKMLAAAIKVDSTEKLATDLRAALFKNWLAQGATPKSIDSLLGVATTPNELVKRVSRDYDIFYGKAKVVETA